MEKIPNVVLVSTLVESKQAAKPTPVEVVGGLLEYAKSIFTGLFGPTCTDETLGVIVCVPTLVRWCALDPEKQRHTNTKAQHMVEQVKNLFITFMILLLG